MAGACSAVGPRFQLDSSQKLEATQVEAQIRLRRSRSLIHFVGTSTTHFGIAASNSADSSFNVRAVRGAKRTGQTRPRQPSLGVTSAEAALLRPAFDAQRVIDMQWYGQKLDKKDWFGKSDPFLEFYRISEDNR